MPVQLSEKASAINSANKAQSTHGLIIQTYCQSVKSQPNVNFVGFNNLAKYQIEINTGLGQAQAHADTYLNVIQPNIISNISNISNYYALHSAIPIVLPSGSTEEQWIEVLSALQQMAATYQGTAEATVISMNGLFNNLTTDSASFTKTVSELNAVVNGDKGMLKQYEKDLANIESNIGGQIAGIVVSGLAIVGGIFITAVGAIAGFVTAGTSGYLVAGGIAIIVAGVSGTVAASLVLRSLYSEKAKILNDQSILSSEVALALGIGTAFSTLSTEVGGAIISARQMSTAWSFLGNDLRTVSDDLKNGILKADMARTLFLKAADSQLQKAVVTDIEIIKAQMTGVQQLDVVPNRSMADTIDALERQVAMVSK